MWKIVYECLQKYQIEKGPLLVGYSGGVDSTALLALLKEGGAELHVLHIHHGWREGSLEEAHQLKEYVKTLGLPFYMESIQGIDPRVESNLEDKYREERLKIFQKYYEQIGAKALVLAHQQDDQAETVFKRIFEGASLSKLMGLKELAEIHGMKVVRPLLQLPKQQLYNFLNQKGLSFIEDSTNKNTHYLRARQREEMFPYIEQKFGKNASNNLCRLAKELTSYTEYMGRRVAAYDSALSEGPWGYYLDFNCLPSIDPFELEYYIRHLCEKLQASISYDALKTLMEIVRFNKPCKKILIQHAVLQHIEVYFDRNILFFLYPLKSVEPTVLHNYPCLFPCQGVMWKIEEIKEKKKGPSWEATWKGCVEFVAQAGPFTVALADNKTPKIKELYRQHKVPVPLRGRFFQLFQEGKMCFDMLMPQSDKKLENQKNFRLSVVKWL